MNPTDFFYDHLQKSLIGPGADVYGLPPETEILRTYPLDAYYSGILYPRRRQLKTTVGNSHDQAAMGLPATDDEIDEATIENNQPDNPDADNASYTTNDATNATEEINSVEQVRDETATENGQPDTTQANQYFPHCMGITICLPIYTAQILVTFSAGQYHELKPNWSQRAVTINRLDYEALVNNPDFPDLFKPAMTSEPSSAGNVLMRIKLADKLTDFDIRAELQAFERKVADKRPVALAQFKLLVMAKPFRREPLTKTLILLTEKDYVEPIPVFEGTEKGGQAKCHVKIIPQGERKYVKLLLENTSPPLLPKQFSLSNEKLNEQSLFQVQIRIDTPDLQPYKNRVTENPFDPEARQIAYQHRTVKAYAIGHGAAVMWEPNTETPGWVSTTFLPSIEIPAVTNGFRYDDRPAQRNFADVTRLRNLSVWSSWKADMVCDKLDLLINDYADWHESQRTHSQEPNQQAWLAEAQKLLEKQHEAINRLRRNVVLLRTNPEVFDCFRLANTAMYLQMIVSRDADFGASEKESQDIIRRLTENSNLTYSDLSFFEHYIEDSDKPIAYRPFQLAFLLLNLESMVDDICADRTEGVDLIWFPTGGGKTEAYLALTAFTIIWRRTQHASTVSGGVSVLMRYTLRLLTAQQFERASRLIVALEFLRRKQSQLPQPTNLGNDTNPITIGMWVGMSTTPNTLEEASQKIGNSKSDEYASLDKQCRLINAQNPIPETAAKAEAFNVFQVSACPWCGCRLITKNAKGEFTHGFTINTKSKRFEVACRNQKCEFRDVLPIDMVDESLYKYPPTLLFATVDKFALIAHQEDAHRFFNSLDNGKLPPDLIIQDELHLLNGPLGSVVGLFEGLVETLCSRGKRRPKIVASTATTRNTDEQVSNLYGGRTVRVFPAQGLHFNDNYFSKNSPNSLRRHIGFMPTGKTSMTTQVSALLPHLLFVRSLLLQAGYSPNDKLVSDYWTVVSYYNSLKQVGKVYSNVSEVVTQTLQTLHARYNLERFAYSHFGLANRTTELTSRIESTRIKAILNDLSKKLTLKTSEKGNLYVDGTIDLVLASNMFSVGIDVNRLNVMLMNGQPKNNAEYIQASSRVARQSKGLVVNLLDANLAREKSYFEQYVHYHLAYYQYVEPLTITPFTEITFGKVLNGVLVGYVRHIRGQNKELDAKQFDGKIADVLAMLRARIPIENETARQQAEDHLLTLAADWYQLAKDREGGLKYKGDLIRKPDYKPKDETEKPLWNLMQSMRDVDTTSVIEIQRVTAKKLTQRILESTGADVGSQGEEEQLPEN